MSTPTLAAHASAQPAVKQPEQIAKRLDETRIFVFDCAPLLAQHELVVKASAAVSSSEHVHIEAARARHGRYLELRISGGQVPAGARHVDQAVSARLDTTTGQQLLAVVQLRVFAE